MIASNALQHLLKISIQGYQGQVISVSDEKAILDHVEQLDSILRTCIINTAKILH